MAVDALLHGSEFHDRVEVDLAGLGGSERYVKLRANANKFFNLGGGWIFSIQGEAGYIKGLKDRGPGQDSVRLTDRFFLGDPQIRGFDIRGIGPRVVRDYYDVDTSTGLAKCVDGTSAADCTSHGGYTFLQTTTNNRQDDPLGGNMYYLVRNELEIPLGSGARELGLRPSIFADIGSVFSVKKPILTDTGPGGVFLPARDAQGRALFTQIDSALLLNGVCTVTATSQVTTPTNNTPPPCIGTGPVDKTTLGSQYPGFRETFLGDTPKPRVAVGIGVNWNSPFGPFRINFAKVLLKAKGDDTKKFTFNVGTQF